MDKKRFYLVGVGGAGVSALGHYLLDDNNIVAGYDIAKTWELRYLLTRNIEFHNNINLSLVDKYDVFVKTIAIGENFPLLQAAYSLEKKVYEYPQYLGEIAKEHKNVIAICGAHGKTTVSGLVAYTLTEYNLNPSYIVGGIVSNLQRNGKKGSSDYLVFEACEFRESFLNINPTIIIATNVEMDHTDYYHNIDKLKNSYFKFFSKSSVRQIIYNRDSKLLVDILEEVKGKEKIPYSSHTNEDCYSFSGFSNNIGITFNINRGNKKLLEITSPLVGVHNAYNITAAYTLADILGLEKEKFSKIAQNFLGMDRRMQKITRGNFTFILDYAHHPTQLECVVETLKKIYSQDILVVFQPHQVQRLVYFEKEFMEVFSSVRHLIFTPIFKAREEGQQDNIIESFLRKLKDTKGEYYYFSNFADIASFIKAKRFKTILLAGAGDIYNILDYFDDGNK